MGREERISRKGAKVAKVMYSQKKFETRNPKFETNPNDQKGIPNKLASAFRFLDFGFEVVRFVSDFELRISNFDSKLE